MFLESNGRRHPQGDTPAQIALQRFAHLPARSLTNFLSNTAFHNRSSRTFRTSEIRLLSYGLSFVPSPKLPSLTTFQRGIAKLSRAMRLRWYFKTPLNSANQIYVPKPDWQPPESDPGIETFLANIETGVTRWHQEAIRLHKNFGCNFRSKDMRKLITLSSDPTLNFAKSDKNLGLNVFDDVEYNREAVRVVSDHTINQAITEPEAKEIVATFVRRSRRLCQDFLPIGLSERDQEFIEQGFSDAVTNPTFPEFYIIPKLLKQPWQGRPITPQFNYVSKWAAKWIAVQLNEFCLTLPTALTDSLSLVKDLEQKHFPLNCEVFGGDVRSSIPLSIPSRVSKSSVVSWQRDLAGRDGKSISLVTYSLLCLR